MEAGGEAGPVGMTGSTVIAWAFGVSWPVIGTSSFATTLASVLGVSAASLVGARGPLTEAVGGSGATVSVGEDGAVANDDVDGALVGVEGLDGICRVGVVGREGGSNSSDFFSGLPSPLVMLRTPSTGWLRLLRLRSRSRSGLPGLS